ncbi:MAG: hypothetical protein ACK46C_18155 [Flavobacteriales bacterium]
MFHLRYPSAALVLVLSISSAAAQYGDLAYAGTKRTSRTADVPTIEMVPTSVPGVVELTLPAGTVGVDVLNARGKVFRELGNDELDQLDLPRIRRGTWTMRIRTTSGYLIRRFVVLGRSSMYWSPADQRSVRGH